MISPFYYLTDPVLRAPTLGSMLMCLASSLIGVLVFIRKRSLLGEALSHASYPGVVFGVIAVASFFPYSEEGISLGILVGAFISALCGLWAIDLMERRLRVKNDAALCFVLSVFLGVGILVSSRLQVTHALWYRQIQLFLYGQTATMIDIHVWIYSILAVLTIAFLFFLYHPLEAINFDRDFAKSIGMRVSFFEMATFLLLVLAIVIGIRCVGVILMAGMLIAPAVTARQLTHRLSLLFPLAALFGVFSGFLGNYFSGEIPVWLSTGSLQKNFSLPTGPMILLVSVFFCLFFLLFAPGSGLVSKFLRIIRFGNQCKMENALKAFWKKGSQEQASFVELKSWLQASSLVARFLLMRLLWKGWIKKEEGYHLTTAGAQRAARIVRLHRLWEVYLVDYLGQGVEKVHHNAEEMEHILTPEIEKELIELLHDPKVDPHQQPIPTL